MIVLIIFFVCIVVFFLGNGYISCIEGDVEGGIAYFIIMVLMIGISLAVIVSVKNNTPEKQNATLLQNIEKANKKYEKFLIDHPEFKIVEE